MSAPVDHAETWRIVGGILFHRDHLRDVRAGRVKPEDAWTDEEPTSAEVLLARAYVALVAQVRVYTDLHGCKHDRLRSADEMMAVTKELVALRACLPPNPETER